MMEKKRSLGITIVSWVIILSNAISLLYILPLGFAYLIPLNFILIIQLFSIDLSGIVIYFPIPFPSFYVIRFILLVLALVVGVGLLKLKSLARIAAVILSSINVIHNIFFLYVLLTPKTSTPVSINFFFPGTALLINIFYIIYLTRPKVKEQFLS